MHKILIVDDDENLRCLYEEEFSDAGYDVSSVESGEECVNYIKAGNRPDLIILDISMPGMDGIEALGKVLAYDKEIRVIINTAYSVYKDNFMTWSADAYVIKSSDLTELIDKAKEVLQAPVEQ